MPATDEVKCSSCGCRTSTKFRVQVCFQYMITCCATVKIFPVFFKCEFKVNNERVVQNALMVTLDNVVTRRVTAMMTLKCVIK